MPTEPPIAGTLVGFWPLGRRPQKLSVCNRTRGPRSTAHHILLHHEFAIGVIHLPAAQPALQHGEVGLGGSTQQAQREAVRRRVAHAGGAARVQRIQQGRTAQASRRRVCRQRCHQLQGCRAA